MKTQELTIEAPKGFEIDKEKSTFEKIVFKEVSSNLQKVFEYHKTTKEAFDKLYENLPLRGKYLEIEAMIVAYKNDGWEYKDGDRVYYPYFNLSPFSFGHVNWYDAYSYVPLALCFKSEKLCKEALEEFEEEYKLSRTTL